MEDEPHTENNQIYPHPLQPYSPANNFFHAQQIPNGADSWSWQYIYQKYMFPWRPLKYRVHIEPGISITLKPRKMLFITWRERAWRSE